MLYTHSASRLFSRPQPRRTLRESGTPCLETIYDDPSSCTALPQSISCAERALVGRCPKRRFLRLLRERVFRLAKISSFGVLCLHQIRLCRKVDLVLLGYKSWRAACIL